MSKAEQIREKTNHGQPVIGTSVTLTDSCVTELLADTGFDFIWIDTEHSSLGKENVLLHIMATRGTGAAAFVRVPWNDPVLVKPILEMGADGIIFPFIRTAEEAENAVKSCRYPPAGVRGFGPIRANNYGMIDRETYIKQADSQILKIIQIEHIDAVNNLTEILKVDGVDAIIVGLNDLGGSIGIMNDPFSDEVRRLTDEITEKAVKAHTPFGLAAAFNRDLIQGWLSRGATLIEIMGDYRFLSIAARDAYLGTRRLIEHEVVLD